MDSTADNSCLVVPVVAGALVDLDRHLRVSSESDFQYQILLLELIIFLVRFSKTNFEKLLIEFFSKSYFCRKFEKVVSIPGKAEYKL